MLRRIATAAIAAVLVAASAATYAATRTWSGATSTSWNTASNWAENAVPVNGDDLVFPDNPTNRTSNNNIAGLSVASVSVTTTNSGAAFNYTGNGITLTGPITFSNPGVGTGSGDPNWAIPIALGASITMTSDGRVTPFNATIDLGANTLTVAGGGDLFVNGVVSGTGGITKNSGSAFQLFGANTYGGATLVNAGTIFVRHPAALGSSATGTTFANGAGLGVQSGPYTLSEPLTFQGPGNYVNAYSNIELAGAISFAGTLTYTAYGPGSISGPVTSSGTLSKNGVDTLSTSGNWPAFTGAVNVVAGGFAPTGTFPAAVNLFAPASLYGYGTTGPLTITGGTFAPGIATFQYFRPAGLASSGGQHNLTLAPGTSGTDYDQIQVTGPVSLGGTTLVVTSAGALPIGGQYSIIDNDGADAVVGTYTGLPEGAQFTMFANTFQITYVGSSGNDVVLTVVDPNPPPPAAPATPIPGPGPLALLLGALALALAARRRLH